jgi:hypothetical protein
MISTHDTFTLALTKLRTRKIRLIITVVISGLLFGLLIAGSLVSDGVFKSVDSFTKEGFGERYIAAGSSSAYILVFNNKELNTRAQVIFDEQVVQKKALAKKLGIEYDPATDQEPTHEFPSANGEKITTVSVTSEAGRQAIYEYSIKHPAPDMQAFQKSANKYGPKTFYRSTLNSPPDGNQLQVLKGGQERYEEDTTSTRRQPTGIELFGQFWQVMSDDLLKSFTLPGENLQTGTDGSVPVIVPVSAAEEFLGLKLLPGSASPKEKLERIKYIRAHLRGTTYQVCSRNASSSALITQAQSVQQEILKNKDNKTYEKPALMYGLPTEACGASPVIRDVRTSAQKVLDDKQRQFNEAFGAESPRQQKFTFRVVGMAPDQQQGNFSRLGEIVNSIVQSTLGSGWYTPDSQVATHTLLSTYFVNTPKTSFPSASTYYAEFNTPKDTLAFIDTQSCPDSDPNKCVTLGKPFTISQFGSNSTALDSLKRKSATLLNTAGLVIVVVAAVIMMGAVGRLIADSRRETAVFRAIGAKRLDISAIYLLYTVFLSTLIILFAACAGAIVATVISNHFSPTITVQALVAYNAQDLNKTFVLFGIDALTIAKILGGVLIAGTVGALIPLLRNIRRNPSRDMRDDT